MDAHELDITRRLNVLITGDRGWTDCDAIRCVFAQLPVGSTVIHGDCRGADRLADRAARDVGFAVVKYPAEWDRYGKAAGILRNQQMLDNERVDVVFAFHSDIQNSRGTRDMIDRALVRNIPVYLIRKTNGGGYVMEVCGRSDQ